MVLIKGHEFTPVAVRNSHERRALQSKNRLLGILRLLGVPEDQTEIPVERAAMRKMTASASWYMWDHHLFFSRTGGNFAENMALVVAVIERFVTEFADGKIGKGEFISLFTEDEDILKQRKEARRTLGVAEDSMDFEEMHRNYKQLSKELHPDTDKGDAEMFKKVNLAHKVLKKELQ